MRQFKYNVLSRKKILLWNFLTTCRVVHVTIRKIIICITLSIFKQVKIFNYFDLLNQILQLKYSF